MLKDPSLCQFRWFGVHPSPEVKPYTIPDVLTNEIPSFGPFGEIWFDPNFLECQFKISKNLKNSKIISKFLKSR